jgi:hypothetical protein
MHLYCLAVIDCLALVVQQSSVPAARGVTRQSQSMQISRDRR